MKHSKGMEVALDDLYMEIILDHYKIPRNKADLSHIDDEDGIENPSCGDSVKVDVSLDADNRIEKARFDGYGCAISTASASMMTDIIVGKSVEETREITSLFIEVLQGKQSVERLEEFGDLSVFGGVAKFPMRVKCATLAWHALGKNLDNMHEK